jgi:DNA-binding FadR family transcriptional regulator
MIHTKEERLGTEPRILEASGSRSIRAQRIPELMAADIRRRILRGELCEDNALPAEAELRAQYSVSRPTLREALRILEAERLIVIRRGGIGGALIRKPNIDSAARQFGFVLQDRDVTMGDIHRARAVIEPPALAALAVTAHPQMLMELNVMLAGTGQFIGDAVAFSRATEALRERIVVLTGATTLSLLMRLLREVFQKHTASVGGIPADRWAKLQKLSQKSHQRLLDLIGEGDAVAAEAFWHEHLREVEHHLGRSATTRVIDLID